MTAAEVDAVTHEREQAYKNRAQLEWHQVTESIQRLAFYVIGLEAVLCGYLLLYAERLHGIRFAPYLFLTSGLAAICGLIWCFYYNETWFKSVEGKKVHWAISAFQTLSYRAFVTFSILVFLAVLASGFMYLREQSASMAAGQSTTGARMP